MSDAAREINEYRNFLEFTGFPQSTSTKVDIPTNLDTDSASGITIAEAEDMTKGTKHMKAREMYIKQEIEYGTVDLHKVSTVGFSVDFLTKACLGSDFKDKRNQHFNVRANPDFSKYL